MRQMLQSGVWIRITRCCLGRRFILSFPHSIFLLHAGSSAGVVRLDRMTKENNASSRWEVSIYIAPDKYGLGLGLAALRLARRLVPEGEFMAKVER